MNESLQLAKQDLDRLQQLRVSVVAFQNMIAPLPATQYDNNISEQFNQLCLDTNALLKIRDFDKKVSPAITEDVLRQNQISGLPYLSGVVIVGVILALFGLGFNSIFVDLLSVAFGCLVSSSGMFLVIGAFLVWGINTLGRRHVSNLGEVYQRCNALLYQIDHTLNLAIPELAKRPAATEVPNVPSVVELALDSLNKQFTDWHQKRHALYDQEAQLAPTVPMELRLNIDFVERQLARVKLEIEQLQGQIKVDTTSQTEVPFWDKSVVHEIPLPDGQKIAVTKVEETLVSQPPSAYSEESAETPVSESFIDTREMKPILKHQIETTDSDSSTPDSEVIEEATDAELVTDEIIDDEPVVNETIIDQKVADELLIKLSDLDSSTKESTEKTPLNRATTIAMKPNSDGS